MDHLPIFCQLRDRDCLIVGGGDVAERKARLLLDAGARLTVNALAFIPQFTAWADAGMLTLVEGPFDESLLDTCWLAIAATDDDALNQRVSEAAEARRIFCNVVDAPKAASFIMPSIIDRSPLMVAVSSGGTSPVLARLLREKLESLLPLHLGQVAKYAGQLRGRVKQQFATMGERRRFWEKLFVNDRLAQSLANNDQKAITETTEQLINEPLDHRGEVVLVGAGPGDAGLLTLKGLQQIQQADVVVYDRLVSDDIMNLVRRDADRVFVGKRAGYHCVPQEEINQIDLLAADIDRETLIKYLDRFMMFYIRTADKLTRTAPWLENLEGGIDYLKAVIIDDKLGLNAHLEEEMARLREAVLCEWTETVNTPSAQTRFKHFINSDKRDPNVQMVPEREQHRPATPYERIPVTLVEDNA